MDTRIKHLTCTIKQERQTVLCGLVFCLSMILIIYSFNDYSRFYHMSRAQESIPVGQGQRTAINLSTGLPPFNNEKTRHTERTPLNLVINGVNASTVKNRSQSIITVNNKTNI